MNTRIRPTPNAEPHAGHAWVAWKNYEAARATGGDFVVIFDDVIYYATCLDLAYPSVAHMREAWLDALTWLFGEPPDRVALASDFTEQHAEACAKLGIRQPKQFVPQSYSGDPIHKAEVSTSPGLEYQTHPAFVVGRVVDDALLHVNAFVRGVDLVRECGLYDYFAHALGYPHVRQSYVPTVTRAALAQGVKESSSLGAPTLLHLRAAGYTPTQIIDSLEECNRRSRKAGLEQNVLPVGILEPLQVRALENRTAADVCREAMAGAAGKAHQQDIEAAVKLRWRGDL